MIFSSREILSVYFTQAVQLIFLFRALPGVQPKATSRIRQIFTEFFIHLYQFFKHAPHFQLSGFLLIQNPDIQSDKWNSQVESYESAIWERRPSVRKGRPPG